MGIVRNSLTVFGGILYWLSLGGCYISWGNTSPYFISWLRKNNPTIDYNYGNYLISFSLICFNIGSLVSPLMCKLLGFKFTSITAILGITASIFQAANVERFSSFLICYGILSSLCMGVAYIIPIYGVLEKFPNKRTQMIITSLLLSSFYMSPAIFNYITASVNSNDIPPSCPEGGQKCSFFDSRVASHVPDMIRKSLYPTMLLMGLIGAFCMEDPKKEADNTIGLNLTQSMTVGTTENQEDLDQKAKQHIPCPNVGTAISSKMFRRMLLANILGSLLPLYIVYSYKKMGLERGSSDSDLTNLGVQGAVVTTLCVIFFKFITICVQFKRLAIVLYVVNAGIGFVGGYIQGRSGNFTLFKIVYLIQTAIMGGLNSVYITEILRIFGQKVGYNITTIFNFSTFAAYLLDSFISDIVGFLGGGTEYTIYVFALANILALIQIYLFKFRPVWDPRFEDKEETAQKEEKDK